MSPPCQVVPFCGVFLKELSDALDGTASIISLKPPLENSEDSLEVERQLQDVSADSRRAEPKSKLTQFICPLFFLVLVCVRLQRPTQLFVPRRFRWLACPGERSHRQQHPPDNQVKRKRRGGKKAKQSAACKVHLLLLPQFVTFAFSLDTPQILQPQFGGG